MKLMLTVTSLLAGLVSLNLQAVEVYAPSPITVKGDSGDKIDSTSYRSRTTRHLPNNSLDKLVRLGNGRAIPDLNSRMMAYFAEKNIDPKSIGDLTVKQSRLDEFSKKKNLKDKPYKNAISGRPGNMNRSTVIEFMIDKAAMADQGFDALARFNHPQPISKLPRAAMFRNQTLDNYPGETHVADDKPNRGPDNKGTYYTGKEPVWGQAFGAAQAQTSRPIDSSRQISFANGAVLTDALRAQLQALANTIRTNLKKVKQ